MARFRVKLLQDGEKASSYFCNLEKRNYTSRSISSIKRRAGQTVFNQKKKKKKKKKNIYIYIYIYILEEIKAWNTNMYHHKKMTSVDLRTLLSNAPPLTYEKKKIMKDK